MDGSGMQPYGPGTMPWGEGVHATHAWWEVFGALVPSLLLLVLIGVAVWGTLRLLHAMGPALASATVTPTVPAAGDRALEELRLRYARGEVDRQAYLEAMGDLGGRPPAPPEAP